MDISLFGGGCPDPAGISQYTEEWAGSGKKRKKGPYFTATGPRVLTDGPRRFSYAETQLIGNREAFQGWVNRRAGHDRSHQWENNV